LASLLQVAHLASLLQVVAPLASLLQVVLVQPLGLLALQQGVRLERLKRVDSGAALVAAARPRRWRRRPYAAPTTAK